MTIISVIISRNKMFSRICKQSHESVNFLVINLRRYRTSTILLRASSQAQINLRENDNREPLILCKNSKFNFYKGKTFTKFEKIPIASQGWHHLKSIGDWFTILPDYEDEIQEELPEHFKYFGVNPSLVENLSAHNINHPTEIQSLSIPKILMGDHSILSAETGCGKTIGYLLPILERIIKWKKLEINKERKVNSPYGLIITPSRELAEQIGREARKLTQGLGIDMRVIIGGRTKKMMMNPSIRELDLLIGSFGAISKLVTNKIYKLNYVKHLVLDEAHALFDTSFDEKLEYFLHKFQFHSGSVPEPEEFAGGTQLILVSATKPSEMPEYLNSILKVDSLVDLQTNNFHRVMVPQKFMRVAAVDKPMTLLKLIKPKATKKRQFIVFSNDTRTCDWISLYLNEFGVRSVHLNGEMPKRIRTGKFTAFSSGEYTVLSTTNAGARGLDTVRVNDVINYDLPMETADYIHRCGRTGRIGTLGECKVTNLICNRLEIELTQKIERAARRRRPLPIFNMLDEEAKHWPSKENLETELRPNKYRKTRPGQRLKEIRKLEEEGGM